VLQTSKRNIKTKNPSRQKQANQGKKQKQIQKQIIILYSAFTRVTTLGVFLNKTRVLQ